MIGRLRRSLRRRLHKSGVPGGLSPESDFSLGVPFGYDPVLCETARVAAMVHMFHPDLAPECAEFLRYLPRAAKVLITTDTEAKRSAILSAFSDWEADRIEVRLVPNRGRDMAPKLTAFVDRYTEFDLILFLHSKKTDHSPDAAGWRQLLFAGLCGSEHVVCSILALFAADPALGLVFPQHHEPIRPYTGWEYNFATARRVARRMGVELRRKGNLEFPSGSMFWARPAALESLLALGLRVEDFPTESGQLEGTPAHAVERLFALSVELSGFGWIKVSAPAHYSRHDTIVTPRSPEELGAFLDRPRLRLRDTMTKG